MSEERKVVTEENNELRHDIKNWQIAFIGIGGVIGSCYFLGMGGPISAMGPAVVIAFAIVGVIVYGTMLCYAELLVNVPRGGSFVAYTSEFVSPTISAGFGWAFWFNWVCYVPSEAIAVSTVLTSLMGTDSSVTYLAIALGAMAAISVINLSAVDIFAKIESGLAITKVIVIISFVIAAFGIWVGLWGQSDTYTGFLAGNVNFGDATMTFSDKLFPLGILVCITNMTVVLVTFQGTEIVGLTAAESNDPTTAVPRACKSVVYRIALLYIVPIILVILVYPYDLATDSNPVFTDIMNAYGIEWLGYVFSAVVMIAAFSCANTGFYGTVRALFGLSIDGLAPKPLSKVSKSGNPRGAAIFTLIFMWCVLGIGLFSEMTGLLSGLYGYLLSLSGFTGAVAWLGIILAWVFMRKKLKANGYGVDVLKARISKGQAWVPWFALVAQIIALIMSVFESVLIFAIAMCAIILPMIGFQVAKKTGKLRDRDLLSRAQGTPFDELFPPIKK